MQEICYYYYYISALLLAHHVEHNIFFLCLCKPVKQGFLETESSCCLFYLCLLLVNNFQSKYHTVLLFFHQVIFTHSK